MQFIALKRAKLLQFHMSLFKPMLLIQKPSWGIFVLSLPHKIHILMIFSGVTRCIKRTLILVGIVYCWPVLYYFIICCFFFLKICSSFAMATLLIDYIHSFIHFFRSFWCYAKDNIVLLSWMSLHMTFPATLISLSHVIFLHYVLSDRWCLKSIWENDSTPDWKNNEGKFSKG